MKKNTTGKKRYIFTRAESGVVESEWEKLFTDQQAHDYFTLLISGTFSPFTTFNYHLKTPNKKL